MVQVTFSVPGTRAPDKHLGDDEIVDALKKIIDEKSELVKQIRELKHSIAEIGSNKKESIDGSKRLKQHLNESVVSHSFHPHIHKKHAYLFLLSIIFWPYTGGFQKIMKL